MSLLSQQLEYDNRCPDSYEAMDAFYDDEMNEYEDEMIYCIAKKLNLNIFDILTKYYAKSIAYSFVEGIQEAKKIFEDLRLKAIHADAVLGNRGDFIYELDRILEERSGAKYD